MGLSGWNSTQKIACVVAAADVGAAQTDIPVLLYISAASGKSSYDLSDIFTKLGANNLKLAVEVGDTGTECKVEVAFWDNTNSKALLYVKVPSLSDTADTTLNLYYDETHADNTTNVGVVGSTPGAAVWSNNYLGVWHLSEDPSGGTGCVKDSLGSIDGTPAGSMTSGDLVSGNIGQALDFDGTDDYVPFSSVGASVSAYTVEVIFKPNDVTEVSAGVVSLGNTATDSNPNFILQKDSAVLRCYSNSGYQTLTSSLAAGTWYHVAIGRASTAESQYLDGSNVANPTVGTGGSITNLYVGSGYSNQANVVVQELRLSGVKRSGDWVAVMYLSDTDALFTFAAGSGGGTSLQSILVQTWSLSVENQLNFEQVYGLKLGAVLEQLWNIYAPNQASFAQVYGLKLGAALVQLYGDAPVLRSLFYQYYGDAAQLKSVFVQRWGDALQLRSVFEQPYTFPVALQSVLEQRYSITQTELQSVFEQVYNLSAVDQVRSILEQVYSISLAGPDQQNVSASVTVGGKTVRPHHINYEQTRSMYCMTGEIHLADQGEFLACHEGDALVITVNGESFHLVVDYKRRQVKHGDTNYIVEALSKTSRLDAPHADTLTGPLGPGMASDIAQGLADPFGITVDWQIVDYYVPADTLYANDETPIALLRRWAGELRGILQTTPAGVLEVKYKYPVSPPPTYNNRPNWDTVEPVAYLSDMDGFFSISENQSPRPGFNRYIISDQLSSAETERLEAVPVSATVKKVRAFVTPWDDKRVFELLTSGGSWVRIEPLGTQTEEIPELVEFVRGVGRTAKPIYGWTEKTWKESDLGGIIFGEDGTLQADVDGESLLEITYTTKFIEWRATDPNIEDVQFILQEVTP